MTYGGHGATRGEVLARLREYATAVPVARLARSLGLHPNTARFHLDALVREGLVERDSEQRETAGRPRVLYRVIAARREPERHEDLAHAMVVHYAGPMRDRRARAEATGVAWGIELRQDDSLAALPAPERIRRCLDRMGYRPKLSQGDRGATLEFGFCPYRELAVGVPSVVCQVHLGLLRGLIDPSEPWEVRGLQAWTTPGTCTATLDERAPA